MVFNQVRLSNIIKHIPHRIITITIDNYILTSDADKLLSCEEIKELSIKLYNKMVLLKTEFTNIKNKAKILQTKLLQCNCSILEEKIKGKKLCEKCNKFYRNIMGAHVKLDEIKQLYNKYLGQYKRYQDVFVSDSEDSSTEDDNKSASSSLKDTDRFDMKGILEKESYKDITYKTQNKENILSDKLLKKINGLDQKKKNKLFKVLKFDINKFLKSLKCSQDELLLLKNLQYSLMNLKYIGIPDDNKMVSVIVEEILSEIEEYCIKQIHLI
ncbi:hypothetical protein ACR3K2_28240 [Cryptosporidium serpentis]